MCLTTVYLVSLALVSLRALVLSGLGIWALLSSGGLPFIGILLGKVLVAEVLAKSTGVFGILAAELGLMEVCGLAVFSVSDVVIVFGLWKSRLRKIHILWENNRFE